MLVGRSPENGRPRYVSREVRGGKRAADRVAAQLVAGVERGGHQAQAGLRWGDLDLDLSTLTIARSISDADKVVAEKDTKTHQARKIALDPSTVDVLRQHWKMQGTAMASAMVSDLAKDDSELAIKLLGEQLPWLAWMARAEQAECLTEILTHLAARAETGTFEPFARAVAEWEHTAEVWADPELAKRLSSDFEGDGREIPRPKARA